MLFWFKYDAPVQCHQKQPEWLKYIQVMLASAMKSPNNSSLVSFLYLCHFYSLCVWGAYSRGRAAPETGSHAASAPALPLLRVNLTSFLFCSFFGKDRMNIRVAAFCSTERLLSWGLSSGALLGGTR